jgi:TPP-dependent pyruvate/acetoin dehydrogenase alpha subunit
MSDPGITYRTKEEIADIRKNKDPIVFVKSVILENKVATEDELKVILSRKISDVSRKSKLPSERSATKLLKRPRVILSLNLRTYSETSTLKTPTPEVRLL